jgi:selenocysteine lyase/cysteine desulfurase
VEVADARKKLLSLTGKNEKDYAVAFTLNTTYGINLVLGQLPPGDIKSIVTSEIEHNSVFLPSITWSQGAGIKRLILKRDADGNLLTDGTDLSDSVVIVSTLSNIDGRGLPNVSDIAGQVHRGSGLLLLDAAQQFGHDPNGLKNTDFDALFGSGHKMYAPSLGFIVIKRTLLRRLKPFFIGGGTVADVNGDSYTLLSGNTDEHSILEPGLQNWAGIVGLNTALDWLQKVRPMGLKPQDYEQKLAGDLFDRLKSMPRVKMINNVPRPVMSFYVDGLDGHKLAIFLSEQRIMCRSGHFCCHHYLQHVCGYPPLVRFSLGLHNTSADIERCTKVLESILKTF